MIKVQRVNLIISPANTHMGPMGSQVCIQCRLTNLTMVLHIDKILFIMKMVEGIQSKIKLTLKCKFREIRVVLKI